MGERQHWFSENTLDRATDAQADGRVEQDAAHENIWWVTSDRTLVDGSLPRYRVQTDYRDGVLTWITCTCSHGRNVGAGRTRCYHAAAVLMEIKIRRDDELATTKGEA